MRINQLLDQSVFEGHDCVMLRCPGCQLALAQRPGNPGNFFECSKCAGRAVSLPVLRKTIAPEAVTHVWSLALSGELLKLNCPCCAEKMVEVTLPGDLHLDVCKRCHFLWFDPNELEQIPEKPPPEPTLDERLPQKARELLALKEIENIRERETAGEPVESWQWLPALLGMPVEQDGRLRYYKAWITWTLAALCVAVAALFWNNQEGVVERFGFVPADPFRMGGLTFLTTFFLHGGIVHLVGNLYFLLVFGDNVEAALGRWKYILLVISATTVGALAHWQFGSSGTAGVPLIGASGGISGIIVCYTLLFPKARLGFLAGISLLFKWFVIPAWLALVAWVGLQIYGVVEQLAGFSNVSAVAHLGGAAMGILFWLGMRRPL